MMTRPVMSGWGCPHEINGSCQRLKGLECDPGRKGCVLHGRFVFSNPAKNRPARPAPVADRLPEPKEKP